MQSPSTVPPPRRELRTRGRVWPTAIARWLARHGVRPNQVSVASVLFSALACAAYAAAGRQQLRLSTPWAVLVGGRPSHVALVWLLLAAAACIQLRLLCNLLDGLLAIEGGLKSRTGDLFNEIPDRIDDILILVGAGYALTWWSWGPALGWLTALLAVLTAYVRLLGGSLGIAQSFSGPMAKQHRMFALTVGTLAATLQARGPLTALAVTLAVIAAGSALTFVLRLRRIARVLATR